MASLLLVLALSLLLTWEMAFFQTLIPRDQRWRGFVSAHVGENLTLECFYDARVPVQLYWYKQILGQRPELIFSIEKDEADYFRGETKNNPRFKTDTESGKALLKIIDLQISDSAIYHCIYYSYRRPYFAESVMVSVKGFGSNFDALVYQPASEIIRSQGAVTLSCTVNTGSCDEEHRVYWYKSSKESPPVLIYTHGGTSGQCDAQSHTCFYQLPTDGLTESDAETYYCAVASCGRLLFGNGTKIDFQNKVNPWVLVYFISGAFVVTLILSGVLAFSLYSTKKKNNITPSGAQERSSSPTTANTEDFHESESLHYAAFAPNMNNRPRKQRKVVKNECVYASVNV